MLWILAGLVAAPARANAQAGAPYDWSLSTRAAAEADHAAGAGPDGTLTVALEGLARRESASFLGSTGGALWLAAGGAAPGLGATHWSRLRARAGVAIDDDEQFVVVSLAVRHRVDWHGTPALSSPRTLWRRPYTGVSAGLSTGWLGLATSRWSAELWRMGFDAGQVRQHDSALTAVQNQVSMSFSLFGLHGRRPAGPDYAFDLLAIDARAIDSGVWSSMGNLDWVRFQGLRLSDTMSTDFSIGLVGTDVMALGAPEDEDEPGTPPGAAREEQPLGSVTAVRGRVQRTHGTVTAALAGHRDAHLTIDGEPALEHRVASEVSWSGSSHAVAVEAFAARTEGWLDAGSERDVTGGVRGTWQRRLDDGWVLDLSVETARSFYASLTEDAAPRAELGARVTAQLSRQFGTQR
jgi:hypothetical protein